LAAGTVGESILNDTCDMVDQFIVVSRKPATTRIAWIRESASIDTTDLIIR
jgi:hypothetical protein